MITFGQVCSRLDENNLEYNVMRLAEDCRLIVSAYGGRIFGPFRGDAESSYSWVNPAFSDRRKFAEMLAERAWNIGGDRLWIAPELQYNVPDLEDFDGSYSVPDDLDPGFYTLQTEGDGVCVLEEKVSLQVHRTVQRKELEIQRRVSPAVNPVPEIPVEHFGYYHEIMLREKTHDDVVSEAWNLLQLNPEGVLYIPVISAVDFTEYYDRFRFGYQRIYPDYVRLKIDGCCKYKVGYNASALTGRSGYVCRVGDSYYLLLRDFHVDPAGQYFKSPAGAAAKTGSALHVYNDDGMMGGFAEHECSCLAIGGVTGRKFSYDRIANHYFTGSAAVIKEVAEKLLGLNIEL